MTSPTNIDTIDESIQDARRQPDDQIGDLRRRLLELQRRWSGPRADPNAERIGSLEEQTQSLLARLGALADDLEELKSRTSDGIANMDSKTTQMIERGEHAEEMREARFNEIVGVVTTLIETLESAPTGPGGGIPKSLLDDVDRLKTQVEGLEKRVTAIETDSEKGADEEPVQEHLTELEAALRIVCRHLHLNYELDVAPKLAAEIAEMEREAASEQLHG